MGGQDEEIGLQPSTTGAPGGKETGQSVTHYIVDGGPYARAYAKLKGRGFQLHWQSAPEGKERFHITMRLTVLQQQTKAMQEERPETGAEVM
jgi:hypothetical protein